MHRTQASTGSEIPTTHHFKQASAVLQTILHIALGDSDHVELEHRCYNGVCLAAAFGCVYASLFNSTVGLPVITGVFNGLIGGIYLWLYVKSRRSRTYRPVLWLYVLAGAVLLIMTWIYNGGIDGSDTFVSMVALVAMTVVCKTRRWLVVLSVFFPIMSILFFLGYQYPQIVVPYSDAGQRYLDVYLTFVISTAVIFAIITLILQNHTQEKERLDALNRILEEKNAMLNRSNRDLEAAISQIDTLNGLLPICSACKKVRDDKGYWSQIEAYIQAHSKAEFTHGICPECAQRLYPDVDLTKDE